MWKRTLKQVVALNQFTLVVLQMLRGYQSTCNIHKPNTTACIIYNFVCHRNWWVLAGMQRCFVAFYCTNIRAKAKKKIITVILRIFWGRKCQVIIQTGCNYKQRGLIQDLVMQGCKRVVCKFDVQRGWIVYIQQSANYWQALKIVRPYNYQWGSQLTIINTTEK